MMIAGALMMLGSTQMKSIQLPLTHLRMPTAVIFSPISRRVTLPAERQQETKVVASFRNIIEDGSVSLADLFISPASKQTLNSLHKRKQWLNRRHHTSTVNHPFPVEGAIDGGKGDDGDER